MSSLASPPIAALSPARALADAAALGNESFDVLVVGGGVVGAGVALDAAARGLAVAIVDAQDWGAGTSSRSSKLIHGGLRYVQSHELALVREALRERSTLLRLAPHLVQPAAFLYPLRHRIEHLYVGAGVAIYDLLARGRGVGSALPRARHLGATAAHARAPALRRDRIVGGVVYYDSQVDDARYVVDLVRTAVSYGARAVSRARVVDLISERGRVLGARVQLLEAGVEVAVRARVVVSATGVWTPDISAMVGVEQPRLRPSKGVHLVVRQDAIDASLALIVPTATSVLFVLPWGRHWIIGTTDTPWSFAAARPIATTADIAFLLDAANAVLVRPIAYDAIESVFVGLRPLLEGDAGPTTKLSREHAVVVPRPGLALVSGGKFTTYRVMAKDVLDAALQSGEIAAGSCRTSEILIAGADGYSTTASRAEELAA